MQTTNRNKIREVNEQQLHERLKVLTSSKELDKNPIDDIINPQMKELDRPEPQIEKSVEGAEAKTGIEAGRTDAKAEIKAEIEPQVETTNDDNLSSLQNRFGVRKIKRPVKDAQLTARIESSTLKRFKEIVKTMYHPDKPNINETVTQIIRAFVEEYDKNNPN